MGHNRRLGGPEENQIVVVNRQPGKKLSQARTLRRSTSEWSGASKLEETACKPHSTLRAGDVTPGRHPVHSSAERARDGPALSGMRGREKKKKTRRKPPCKGPSIPSDKCAFHEDCRALCASGVVPVCCSPRDLSLSLLSCPPFALPNVA